MLGVLAYDVVFFVGLRVVQKSEPGDIRPVMMSTLQPKHSTLICDGDTTPGCAAKASADIGFSSAWLAPHPGRRPGWLAAQKYRGNKFRSVQLVETDKYWIFVISDDQQVTARGNLRSSWIEPGANTATGNAVIGVYELKGKTETWQVTARWCWGQRPYCDDYGLIVQPRDPTSSSAPPIVDNDFMRDLYKEVRYG